MRCQNMDWINLAQERVQGRALVNTVMNLGIQYNQINLMTS
jgi:hypothetical protein